MAWPRSSELSPLSFRSSRPTPRCQARLVAWLDQLEDVLDGVEHLLELLAGVVEEADVAGRGLTVVDAVDQVGDVRVVEHAQHRLATASAVGDVQGGPEAVALPAARAGQTGGGGEARFGAGRGHRARKGG